MDIERGRNVKVGMPVPVTMKRSLKVFHPGASFPSVSVTGPHCSRSCEHCSGRYLQGMHDVSGRNALYEFGIDLSNRGGKGLLVSGGCGPDGGVPMSPHILRQISRLKKETDLVINMHTGLIDPGTAGRIGASGVDMVSFDLIGDNETIRRVLHLDRTVGDFERSYSNLREAGLRVTQHILSGFHYGKERGERRAVDIASRFEPERAVMIILIPTPGTPMENVAPMKDGRVLSIARYMRGRLKGELFLGCMRPRGNSPLEIALLEAGFNGIVLPSRRTMEYIEEKGYIVEKRYSCCAV